MQRCTYDTVADQGTIAPRHRIGTRNIRNDPDVPPGARIVALPFALHFLVALSFAHRHGIAVYRGHRHRIVQAAVECGAPVVQRL